MITVSSRCDLLVDIPAADGILVCDVGGSHISVAVCQNQGLLLGPVARAHYPAEQSPQAFGELIRSLAISTLGGGDAGALNSIEGLSLAFPGPFDYVQGISQMEHKLAYLKGIDLRALLAERFQCKPLSVRFLNDAAAFLLGELGAGAAQGAERLLCLTFGTGLGAAFAIAGEHVTQGRGVPDGGEAWNLPYKDGILEDLLSTRGIRANYRSLTQRECEVAELANKAERDPAARAAFEEFGRNLGEALRTVLPDFAPATVVMGGNIARSANLFLPSAMRALGNIPFELKVSALFDSAALYGAALHWYRSQRGTQGASQANFRTPD